MKIKILVLASVVIIVVGSLFAYKQLSNPNVKSEDVEEVKNYTDDTKDNSVTGYIYIPIPQMGISLAVQDSVKDFKYSINSNELYFTRASFEAKSSYCLTKDAPFGTLTKVLKKNLTNDSNGYWATTFKGVANAVKEGYAKDFGDFYLIYITPSDPSCAVEVQAKGSLISLEKTKAI